MRKPYRWSRYPARNRRRRSTGGKPRHPNRCPGQRIRPPLNPPTAMRAVHRPHANRSTAPRAAHKFAHDKDSDSPEATPPRALLPHQSAGNGAPDDGAGGSAGGASRQT